MRLRPDARVRPQLPTTPLASLALLVFSATAIAGAFAAARGPGMRFATTAEVGGTTDAMVRVGVVPGGIVTLEGIEIPPDELAARLAAALAGRPGAGVRLVVSPEADYGAMLAAYGVVASLPGPPAIALPTRGWLEAGGAP